VIIFVKPVVGFIKCYKNQLTIDHLVISLNQN